MMELFNWITELDYLAWFTIGLIFAISELFVPGVYLLWFGLASFTMGVLVHFMTFTPIETCVIFALLGALYSALGWWTYAKVLKKTSGNNKYLNDMAGAHIGKVYNLSQDVVDGRAKAKVGDSFWLIQTENDDLKKGDKVKVIGVEDGVILKVEKYEKK
ncbi:MAG: NfeD family protein [Alphaproteobacteria bacterium]|nr:NfeD family protein [Alphaproteobacteria bacterium]